MNKTDTSLTSLHTSNNKECYTEGSGRKPETMNDNFHFLKDHVQRIKVVETLFSLILETLKTDQSTLK